MLIRQATENDAKAVRAIYAPVVETTAFAMFRSRAFYCAFAGVALLNPAHVGLNEVFRFTS